MKTNLHDILQSPIITEKATRNTADFNQYTFQVSKRANKNQIKQAVEQIYNVQVKSVHVMNIKGKIKQAGARRIPGKTSGWKKALIKLKEGQVIEYI